MTLVPYFDRMLTLSLTHLKKVLLPSSTMQTSVDALQTALANFLNEEYGEDICQMMIQGIRFMCDDGKDVEQVLNAVAAFIVAKYVQYLCEFVLCVFMVPELGACCHRLFTDMEDICFISTELLEFYPGLKWPEFDYERCVDWCSQEITLLYMDVIT